jgi:hypothetical protein
MSENAMMLAPVQAVSLEREAAGYQALLGVIMQAGEFGKGLLKNIATPLDALALADAGAAFGMTPLTALRSFHMVEGKPVLAADRMVALCLAHPACMAFGVEVSTAERCVYMGRRRQRDGSITEQRVEWTMKRALAAGVAGKPVWKQYPDQMLRARAGSELARMLFPDAMAGIYTAEELGDSPTVFDGVRPSSTVTRTHHPLERPAIVEQVEDAVIDEGQVEDPLAQRLYLLAEAIDPEGSPWSEVAVLWYLASRPQAPASSPTLPACLDKLRVSDAAWAKTAAGMVPALQRRMAIVGGLDGARKWLRALPAGCPAEVKASAASDRHAQVPGAGSPGSLLGIALAVAEESTEGPVKTGEEA